MDLEKQTTRKVGAPFGNQNARKTPFKDAFKRKAVQETHRIELMIEKQYVKAEEGDLAALNMIIDRTEGKPMQSTEVIVAEGTDVKGIMLGFVEGNGNKD